MRGFIALLGGLLLVASAIFLYSTHKAATSMEKASTALVQAEQASNENQSSVPSKTDGAKVAVPKSPALNDKKSAETSTKNQSAPSNDSQSNDSDSGYQGPTTTVLPSAAVPPGMGIPIGSGLSIVVTP